MAEITTMEAVPTVAGSNYAPILRPALRHRLLYVLDAEGRVEGEVAVFDIGGVGMRWWA